MNILAVHPHDILTEPWTIRIVKFCEEFNRRGHEVTLVYFPNPARRNNQTWIRKEGLSGVRVLPLPKFSLPQNVLRLRQLAEEVDVLYFQKAFPHAALPVLSAALLTGKPVHYDWDDNETAISKEWTSVRAVHALFYLFERWLPSMVETLSVSTQGLKELAIRYGAREEKIAMAPVGADTKQFLPAEPDPALMERLGIKPPVVIYIGQLEGGSYCEGLLRAASAVLKKKPETRFLIVGGGYKLPDLKTLAKTLGIERQITFTDYVSQNLIPSYLSVADVAVAVFEDTDVSRYKSPLKIAEYMSAGKAIVANRVGDVSRMLGTAGVLVDSPDPNELSSEILNLLNDPEARRSLGKSARLRAETYYNWSKSAENILAVLER
jgi:glycosyltransferase involved in cell wall biosynthesis